MMIKIVVCVSGMLIYYVYVLFADAVSWLGNHTNHGECLVLHLLLHPYFQALMIFQLCCSGAHKGIYYIYWLSWKYQPKLNHMVLNPYKGAVLCSFQTKNEGIQNLQHTICILGTVTKFVNIDIAMHSFGLKDVYKQDCPKTITKVNSQIQYFMFIQTNSLQNYSETDYSGPNGVSYRFFFFIGPNGVRKDVCLPS